MEANHNFKPVRPEDIIDVRSLRRLAREGRLYLLGTPLDSKSNEEYAVERALEYVSQIEQYAHTCAKPYLSALWHQILTDSRLNDKLTMQKGQNEGELNRYRLMYLVTYLLESGIYCGVTALRLHHILEHTNRKDNIYKGQMLYAMNSTQLRIMRGIIAEFRTKYLV